MRSVRSLVAAAASVAVVFLASAAPSQGHSPRVDHPSDGSWAQVSHDPGNHDTIAVCDGDPDGNLTYARYELLYDGESWDPNYRLTGYDGYGRNSAGEFCHHEGHWSPFRRIAVCVQNEGCSAWKEVGF